MNLPDDATTLRFEYRPVSRLPPSYHRDQREPERTRENQRGPTHARADGTVRSTTEKRRRRAKQEEAESEAAAEAAEAEVEVEEEEEEEAPPPAPGAAVSAPPTDSEPSKWQVGQLVEARAQNSGARAGYEHCHIKAVQPDGRYTVRFTDEAFDQSDIVDVLALGSSLGRLRRGPSVILPPHARLYG